MRVAIILVNWNSFDLTNDCISSLNEISYNSYNIIVIDNGSADGSGDKIKEKHPNIILLKSDTNLGFTGGNNIGLQYSLDNGYEYSILLNNDTFVEKGFLNQLVHFMDQHPECGIIQPRIFFHTNRKLLWNGGSYYSKTFGWTYTKGYSKQSGPQYEYIKEVDWVTGCAFLTRNNILEKTGLLASNLFIYYEDVDLSFRIKKLGYILIYYPDSVIYHIAGMANKNKTKGKEGYLNPFVHYLSHRNQIWIIKQYTPWYCIPTVIIFRLFYTFTTIVYFVLRRRFRKLGTVIRGVKDGIIGSIKY
jgi:GT2 family glycosyltransferase